MHLKHVKTLLPPQEGAAKICCLAYAPNNDKMAVCTYDRVILLYDEQGEKRDKFATKPADPKYGKKSYMVKGLAFSPDGTKIAVGQTDDIIYVYKIGSDWNEQKKIVNKFVLHSAVTCLVWLPDDKIIFGTADGKVRLANVKSNKSSALYDATSYVISLAVSPSGKGFLSGHADGSIVRYFVEDEGNGDTSGKLSVHPCPPYGLAWGSNSFIAAGCDKRVFAYSRDGRIMQQFDYSREDEQEFTTAVCSPSGQSVVVGSYDRLRVFNWSPRKGLWDEAKSKDIANLYTITALAWKKDGSKLVAGSLCGCVELFDCCLKKVMYKNRFEISHVGPSQVNIKDLSSGSRISLKSFYAYEIDEVKIMGDDQYVVAHTSDTLMLADLAKKTLSEVPWRGLGGNEKYIFDHDNVCVIFNSGELTLIEYGKNEILGSVRTEFISRHLISVRINERKQKGSPDNKKIAYLVDLKTIAIVDLVTGMVVGNISHDTKVGWLELSETGHKLLFRDSKLRLHLYDVENQTRTTILNYCSYVQWVPGSDIVVAQNRGNLCVWYNIDAPERVKMDPIKGDIVDLERRDGKTDVIVNEGVSTVTYTLDEIFVEFGTALVDRDYARAVAFLENLEMTPETEANWKTLSQISLDAQELVIAERCFAALGDVSKARYLHETNEIAEEAAKTTGGNGFNHYKVRARMAIMDKNFKLAESIYLEQNQVEEAMQMYQALHKWDDAINVAEYKNHPELENLRKSYYQWLMETHQEDKAGELKEREGDDMAAISLFMKAGMPARAAKVITGRDELMNNSELVGKVSTALIKGEMYERAGDLFEKVNRPQDAIQCYKKGCAYRRAVDLARHTNPEEVVKIELEWGNYLAQQKQLDAAINHFIEAGDNLKAVDAAIHSRQWQKAGQILDVIPNGPEVKKYYKKLGQHYSNIGELELAEKYYLDADCTVEAIDMYNTSCKWEEAYRLASTCMKQEEVTALYVKQAAELESKGRYKDAERLYITVSKQDNAITMYKNVKHYNDMIRLVKQYRKEYLGESYLKVAELLEAEGNLRQAEHFLLEANKVSAAINMYRKVGKWEDCYRVAKSHGSPDGASKVAVLWAHQLGGDSAVKLLTKLNLLDWAIDHALEQDSPDYFDFALELCKIARKEKLPLVAEKYGEFLENQGHYKEAEAEFIKAGKPRNAILMYVTCHDWESAQRVAEQYDKDSLPDVLVVQARSAFDNKDYQKAESYLLRAQRPELVVKHYKEAGMWQDALRVCKEYLPNMLEKLQAEYDREISSKTTKGADTYIEQAQDWESKGEYAMAVDCYAKVTPENTTDVHVLEKCYAKATDLAQKFLGAEKAVRVVQRVCPVLVKANRCSAAAELYLTVEKYQDAIDAYIAGEEWNKAKSVAKNYEPRLEPYVDEKYKQYLKDKDKLDTLEGVDVEAALERYASKGEWAKAISIAEKKSPKLLHKYVAMYAANLIKNNKLVEALGLYVQHGAPALSANFSIYKHLFEGVVNMPNTNNPESFKLWSDLRDMLFDLCNNLSQSQMANGPEFEVFDNMLTIAHYYATRSAALPHSSLAAIATKLSISLLRHTDFIPADKAFYEAGTMCKTLGLGDMACVFLNRYLDLVEAIEDQNLDIDNEDLQDTDIPLEIPLPKQLYVPSAEHEEVREWVLSTAMDKQVNRGLDKDERDTYEASLIDAQNGARSLPCSVSGYPVLRNKIEFKRPNKAANKDDWNKFLLAVKTSPSSELKDVLKFVDEWCGIPANAGFSYS